MRVRWSGWRKIKNDRLLGSGRSFIQKNQQCQDPYLQVGTKKKVNGIFRARSSAQGFKQVDGLNYDETTKAAREMINNPYCLNVDGDGRNGCLILWTFEELFKEEDGFF